MKSKTNLTKEQKDVLNGLVSIIPSNLKFSNKTEKEVFALIYYMDSKHNGEQFTCGYKEFEESCGLHRNTVSRYIELLKCKGYINYIPGYKNHNSDFVCCVDTDGNIVHKDIVHNQQTLCINIVHNEPIEIEEVTPNIVHNNNATLCTNNNSNNKDNNNSKDNTKLLVEIVNKLDKLISLKDMTNTDSLVEMVNELTTKVSNLTNQVEELKKDNSRLNDRLNKAALVIKNLSTQPANKPATNPIEVNKKVESDTNDTSSSDNYEVISSCIDTIKSNSTSFDTKLESVKQLINLVQSGKLTPKQVEIANKWIDPYRHQLKSIETNTNLDDQINSFTKAHKSMMSALTNKDYKYVKEQGENYINQRESLRTLSKAGKLSKEAHIKLDSAISNGNSVVEEVTKLLEMESNGTLNLENCNTDTVKEAKKTEEKRKADENFKMYYLIKDFTDQTVNVINLTDTTLCVADVKKEFNDGVKSLEGFNMAKHYGHLQNALNTIDNTVRMHNLELAKKTA